MIAGIVLIVGKKADVEKETEKEMAMKKQTAFIAAAACLVAVPFVIEALSHVWGRTLEEERKTRAFLFFCVTVALLVVIFRFWMLG